MRPSGKRNVEVYQRDRDLAARAKEGDIDARNKLVALYVPLSLKIAGKFRTYVEETQDLSQEALLRLTKRIKDYDPSRAEFIIFAYGVLIGEVMTSARIKRKKFGKLISLDKSFSEDEELLVNTIEDDIFPKSDDDVKKDSKLYLEEHLGILPKIERKIIDQVLLGKNSSEIARSIGRDKHYVQQYYSLAIKRLGLSIKRRGQEEGIEALLS